MTNTAVALINDEAKALLEAAKLGDIGVGNKGTTSLFPTLKIVQENDQTTTTEEALEIPFGSFNLVGTNLIAKDVIFQPLASFYKIIRSGDTENNYVPLGETVFFKDWSDEKLDTFGGVSCGRLIGKQAKELTPDEKKENDERGKVHLYIFGMVTFPGVDPILCQFRVSGGKMVRWTDATNRKVINSNINERKYKLSTISPKKDPQLTKQQQQEARGTYVNLVVEPQMDTIVSAMEFENELIHVLNHVVADKHKVLEQHDKARQGLMNDGDYIDGDVIEIEDLE